EPGRVSPNALPRASRDAIASSAAMRPSGRRDGELVTGTCRRGAHEVVRNRWYLALRTVGGARGGTGPTVVEQVSHDDGREGRDEPLHVQVHHVIGVRNPGLGYEDERVRTKADALRHALRQHLLQVDARGSELPVGGWQDQHHAVSLGGGQELALLHDSL